MFKQAVQHKNFPLIAAIITSAFLIGISLAQAIRANISLEAETGTVSGQALKLSDSLASGGSYVAYDASAPPPTGNTFSTTFETPADFYDRFWTYTGNYCTHGTTCRPEEHTDIARSNFSGDHNTACEAPTTQRDVYVGVHSNLFWWCAPGGDTAKGHMMVANSTSGYAIIGFTPRQTFTNLSSVCWDQNLTDLGGGKWFTMMMVPKTVVESNPNTNSRRVQDGEGPYRLDYTLPEFDADNAPGDFNLQQYPRFHFKLFRNELRLFDYIATGTSGPSFTTLNGHIAGDDKATRFKHCLTENSSGQVVLSQVNPSGTQTWNTGLHFPDMPVYVIFADDTYDDVKHGGTVHKSWHFDNITIQQQ